MPEEKEQEIIPEEDEGSIEEKLKKLRDKLKQCQQEKQDFLTGWQRAQADFINYRRRQEEQMGKWSKMLGEGLLRDILPVLDTLDASVAQAGIKEKITSTPPSPPFEGEGEILPNPPFIKEGAEGLKMVKEQLMKILTKHGLTEMKSVGEKFNHDLHEAVEAVETENEKKDTVVEEVQKGYLLNGKVIRVAKVKVTK